MKKHIVVKASNSVQASNYYGGAYDLEGAEFFTKEELMEFADTVIGKLAEQYTKQFDLLDAWIENNLIHLEIQDEDGYSVSGEVKIDMRRIRKPSDIFKYVSPMIGEFERNGLDEMIDVTSATVEELQSGMEKYINRQNEVGKQLDTLQDKTKKRFGFLKKDRNQSVESTIEIDDNLGDAVGQMIGEIEHEILHYLNLPESTPYNRRPYIVDNMIQENTVLVEIIFRPQLNWDQMVELEALIRPIAEYYDRISGYAEIAKIDTLMVEVLKSEVVKEDVDSTTDINARDEYWLDPPEYDEPEEINFTEEIEVDFDCNILIEPDGSWTYEDPACPWADGSGKHGIWYTEEYGVYLGDNNDIVEHVDDLLQTRLPDAKGRYHISGTATLNFNVSEVYKSSTFQGMDEDNDPITDDEYDTSGADVDFDYSNSYISNFDFEFLGD